MNKILAAWEVDHRQDDPEQAAGYDCVRKDMSGNIVMVICKNVSWVNERYGFFWLKSRLITKKRWYWSYTSSTTVIQGDVGLGCSTLEEAKSKADACAKSLGYKLLTFKQMVMT